MEYKVGVEKLERRVYTGRLERGVESWNLRPEWKVEFEGPLATLDVSKTKISRSFSEPPVSPKSRRLFKWKKKCYYANFSLFFIAGVLVFTHIFMF